MPETTIVPPVAPAPVVQPSPKTPVPPAAGTPGAHLEAAKKVFAPDPAKAAPVEPAKAEPVKAPVADAPLAIVKAPDAPAPVEFPEDKLPEPKTEEAKAGWKELKTMAKTLRNEKLALETQIAELKKAPATPDNSTEIEQLRAEHKKLLDEVLVTKLERHPDFVRQYSEPKKKAISTAAEVMGYQTKPLDTAELPALLGKPLKDFNAAVSEITKEMNSGDAATVAMSLRQARDIHGQEQAALAQAGTVHSQLQQKAQQAQKQAFESVSADVIPNFQSRPIADTMTAEEKNEATAYNQSIAGLKGAAESIAFGKLGERDVANLAYKGAALDHMVRHALPYIQKRDAAQRQMIADLTAQVAAFKGGKAPAPGGDPVPAAPAGESIEAAAKRVWRGGA